MPAPLDIPVISPVYVGRAAAVTALGAVLRRAMGPPAVAMTESDSNDTYRPIVLVSGEAGIGKSRLVAEAKLLAAQLGAHSAQGNCFEPDRAAPYAPLLDLLRAMCAGLSDDATARLFGTAAPEVIKLLPELASRLPGIEPAPALAPERERRRLFETLVRFFLEQAEYAPLLLVLEDLHWCDYTSLEFLLTLARRAAHLATPALVLVLTYRSDDVDANLRHFLAELDRGRLAQEVALAPLSGAEVEVMLRAIFTRFDLPRPPRADFLDALQALTDGNPFFIEEVLRALLATDEAASPAQVWQQTPASRLRIPRSVHDAVQGRLRQLSQAAREIAVLAAVAGQRFDFALLQRLTAHDEGELLRLIKELIAAQLVVERSADQFAFRHALTREAIYAELLARERKALHCQIVAALEELYVERLDAHLADLAYHAYEGQVWERALRYSQQVGYRSLRLHAPRAAIEHFTHALQAAAQLSQPADAALYRARGLAYAIAGAFEEAQADGETTLRLALETGDQRMEWQALLDLGKLWAERDYPRTGDYFSRAYALARAMDDPAMLAYSLNRLGNWHLNTDQPQMALRSHQEALAIFRQLDDARGIAETLDLLGMASLLSGDAPRGAVYYQDAIPLLRTLDDQQILSSTFASLAICGTAYQSEIMVAAPLSPTESTDAARQGIALARVAGWRSGESYAHMTLACCLGFQGNATAALHAGLTALDIALEIQHQQWTAASHWALGSIYLDILAWDAAHRHLEQGLRVARSIGGTHWIGHMLGYLIPTLLARGEIEQAEGLLAELLPPDTPILSMSQRSAWRGRIVLALARGRLVEALAIAERMLAAVPAGMGPAGILVATQLHGETLAALHRFDEAATVLQAARALAETQGAIPRLWRIDIALGRVLEALGQRDAAEAARVRARATIEALAAAVPEATLRAPFLSQALVLLPPPKPLAAPPTPRAEVANPGGLTARERQVARCVAAGKSNRAIAEELVVSERTIESHVANILGKLAFTSRIQIAVWATEKRP